MKRGGVESKTGTEEQLQGRKGGWDRPHRVDCGETGM